MSLLMKSFLLQDGFSVNLPMRPPFPDGQAVQRLLPLAWGSGGAGPRSAAVCVPFPPGVPLQASIFPPGHMPPKENSLRHQATVEHFLPSCDQSSACSKRFLVLLLKEGHLLPGADALHLMVSSHHRTESRLHTVPFHPLAIWPPFTVSSEVACTHHFPQGWHPLRRHLGHFFNISTFRVAE